MKASIRLQVTTRVGRRVFRGSVLISAQTPGPDEADVGIYLSYAQGRPLPDAISRSLFNGVHSGIAIDGGPIPKGGLYFDIKKFTLKPGLKFLGRMAVQNFVHKMVSCAAYLALSSLNRRPNKALQRTPPKARRR